MGFSLSGIINRTVNSAIRSVNRTVNGVINNKITQPINRTINGFIGNINSGINNGINNITGGLTKNGFSIDGSINNLEQKDIIKFGATGELKSLYEPKTFETLQYPQDLDDSHYLLFNIRKRQTTNDLINDPETTTTPVQTIVLPIPVNVADNRNVDYNTANLGILGGLGAGAISGDEAYRDLSAAVKNYGGQALSQGFGNISDMVTKGFLDSENKLSDLAALGTSALVLRKLGVGGLGAGAAALKYAQGLLFANGVAYNPRMAVLFNGVNFREFSFQYRLIARNQQESQEITDIVRKFQYYMLPSYVGETRSQFDYPFEFQLEFADAVRPHLFEFQPAVLRSVNVSYNGDTGPAFFEDTNAPIIVDIQMNFQETRILTRDNTHHFSDKEIDSIDQQFENL